MNTSGSTRLDYSKIAKYINTKWYFQKTKEADNKFCSSTGLLVDTL
jgi:hypothetical protein